MADNRKTTGIRKMNRYRQSSIPALEAAITRHASKQTYCTIKFLADRHLVDDAYRAYAYFRWVDDYIDHENLSQPERISFVERQRLIIDRAYHGDWLDNLSPEERMVVELIQNDGAKNDGLRVYIENMMAVMAFDAERRGQTISQSDLKAYTRWLATAVTEAMHYFIGHKCAAPQDDTRYLAVTAAHITHMLRDAIEDMAAGYFNIPQEFLAANGIEPDAVSGGAYRMWVQNQVQLARRFFQTGKTYLARVENRRCRIAGYAYIARFEVVLEAIEKDGFQLRADYPERKSIRAALKMAWSVLSQALKAPSIVSTLSTAESMIAKETS